jgi:hypothetical protein
LTIAAAAAQTDAQKTELILLFTPRTFSYVFHSAPPERLHA